MTEIAHLHRRALDSTGRVVAGISADQLDLSTPDANWDVRALLNHVVGGNLWAAELAAGRTIEQVGDRLNGDVIGADPAAAYDRSALAAAAAFEAPGALDAPCAVSYGPVPGSVYAGHRFIDVLIHGWDLAQATGQDTKLEPGLVDACTELLEPQVEAFRAAGAIGPAVPTEPGASPQIRLLAMLGRRG
ncbi:MAG TPA: TIGR03086 family metal-binding protein [Streptosporangiaceae bacterium]|nr:TIGR03086 family metal-binding protein [Streptosporangiaceae bacterium]